ncbi:uncharacterized protein LOC115396678 [Salarias fasciatus]|uniref:Uncharacterized LOC115396678 n=1 Tax=Salarias fasciatus TaxID=181472 RepID=A0A672HTJ1_SALFA|nr:uncharacterized protein LOC115396678 [Salarias fasciatus]
MAAVDPSKSPERQNSPAEDVEAGEKSAEAEEHGAPGRRDEDAPEEPAGSTEREPGASGGSGGGIASHPDVGVESAAGADKTPTDSPKEPKRASNSSKQNFDWSEPEDEEGEAETRTEEAAECDAIDETDSADETESNICDPGNITSKAEERGDEAGSLHNDKRSTETSSAEDLTGDVDGTEDVAEDKDETDQGDGADLPSKQNRCRLVCKECGETFNRRETFSLHRHFHLHEDALTPLKCKECGLTFQHRSSLIKHKNEHKEKEEKLISPKKEAQTKQEGIFQCAECHRIFNTVGKLRDHNCSNTVEKPYHCPLCRQEFQFRVSVTKHILTHSQESIFSCQECSQTFPNASALRLHQKCHSALKPYECPECGMVFKHYYIMEDHRRKHVDNNRSHLCNVCGKSFKYSSLLHQHQYLHTGQKPFRCPDCGKKFALAQNMKAHCRLHRLCETKSCSEQLKKQAPASAQEVTRGPGKENADRNEETKRTFNCPLCPQSYCTAANLRAHMLVHEAEYETLEKTPRLPEENNKHWETGHTCPHCPCVYRDESSLNKHLLSVHKALAYLEKLAAPPPKPQLAPLSSDNVQAKVKIESVNIKSYKCSECEKSFRHRSVLELHMRIHSKDRPYQCKVCGKGFRFSSYLQQHVIIHTGKKPYKCSDCGKDFAFLQNMKTHQRLHQEKPFRCTSCRKGYSDETQLQQHMLSHNGDKPHKCDLCDKSFGLAYLLRDHMNTHTGERPHRCDECHKTFSWFSSLLVHQKIHARKRQGFSQYNSFQSSTRMRGRGNRGRRGGRFAWGWSRPLGSSATGSSNQPSYSASAQKDAELPQRTTQSPSPMPSVCKDSQSRKQNESWMSKVNSQPVQWKVDGGEIMPVLPAQNQQDASQQTNAEIPVNPGVSQRGAGVADVAQLGSNSVTSSNSAHIKENTSSVSSFSTSVLKIANPSAGGEVTQPRQHKLITWSSAPPSNTVIASTSSGQLNLSAPASYAEGAALWSVRPAVLVNSQSSPKPGQDLKLSRWPVAPVQSQKEPSVPPKKEGTVWDQSSTQVNQSTVSQLEKPRNGYEPQKPQASALAGGSASVKVDQSSAIPISNSVSLGAGSTLWNIQTPPGIPKTINSTEKIVKNPDFPPLQKQVSSGWANIQTATQKVPISIKYEAPRFGQGIGTPIWGFQGTPVVPQTLLTGQLKPGNGPELQSQPMVTGTQIIINQSAPFFSPPLAPLPPLALPGAHPLHSVAVGTVPRPPHPNIFFTPQAVMSERPHLPQTLPLPQLTQRTEPHKLGTRLPFPPERLLQCMICGCSLPRELDLQMHYLQHAQGEI